MRLLHQTSVQTESNYHHPAPNGRRYHYAIDRYKLFYHIECLGVNAVAQQMFANRIVTDAEPFPIGHISVLSDATNNHVHIWPVNLGLALFDRLCTTATPNRSFVYATVTVCTVVIPRPRLGLRLANPKCCGQCMTIWTQKPQVVLQIVEVVSVNMINLQSQGFPLPLRTNMAPLANIFSARGN